MAALRAIRGSLAAPALRLPAVGQSRGGSGGLRAHLDRWAEPLGAAAGWVERWRLRNLNAYRGSLRDTFGDDIAAAEFTLACGGGVRFLGQQHWIRRRNRSELLQVRHLPVVGIDLSDTHVTYQGLDNLVSLSHLSHLDLSRCPHISDWALARLHVFSDTLQHLALASCPQVTERGLAALHPLRQLQSLDVSGLSLPSPAQLHLLLQEILPECQILGLGEPSSPPGPPQ